MTTIPDLTNGMRYEVRDRRAYLTLNRPEVHNAVSRAMKVAIGAAVGEAEVDDDVLVLIVRGAGGRAFSAGADIKEIARNDAAGDRGDPRADTALEALDTCRKPVLAAIDGICYGQGLEIALRCDIRLATEQSRFALPEPRRGLIAGYGLHHLSRVIPLGEALLLQLTGAPMAAQRAYDVGLIQGLSADRAALDAEVEHIAAEICACAPLALQAIKHIVKVGRSLPPEYSVQMALPIKEALLATEDRREGPAAFAEKRQPQWKMR